MKRTMGEVTLPNEHHEDIVLGQSGLLAEDKMADAARFMIWYWVPHALHTLEHLNGSHAAIYRWFCAVIAPFGMGHRKSDLE